MIKSLRGRLMFGTTTATVVLVATASIVLFVLVRRTLVAELDRSLADRLRTMSALVELEDERLEVDLALLDRRETAPQAAIEYFQLWDAAGAVLAKSSALGQNDLPRLEAPSGDPSLQFVVLDGGQRARLATLAFEPLPEGGSKDTAVDAARAPEGKPQRLLLAVARSTDALDATLARLGGLLAVVSLVTMALIPIALAGVLHLALRPVERLTHSIAAVNETRLDERLDVGQVPQELVPVVERLNDLMQRMASAFAREKQFTADAAHELRTPLAGIRNTLELALTRRREVADYQQSIQTALAISCQMQALVETLLSLARHESHKQAAPLVEVAVGSLLEECWELLDGRARERKLTVQWHLDPDLVVPSDEHKLRLILRNVLENAVEHANDAGYIRVAAGRRAGVAEIRITNSGSRVASEAAIYVFDRFWRADAARSAGPNAGLGLSLCKQLAEALGCEIDAQSEADGEFSLSLRFRDQPNRPRTRPAAAESAR